MKEKNTLSKIDFLVYTLIYAVPIIFYYRTVLFKPLDFGELYFGGKGTSIFYTSLVQSKIIFWSLALCFVLIGTYTHFKKKRNFLSIFLNVTTPIEIYTLLATFHYYPTLYTVTLCIIAFLSLTYFFFSVFQKIRYPQHKKRIIKKRIITSLSEIRTLAIVLLFLVVLPLNIKFTFGYSLYTSNADVVIENAEPSQWTLKNNKETIVKLHENTWYNLSTQEKLDILGCVKNIEMEFLGVNDPVFLVADILDENILGSFNCADRTITIDVKHLENDTPEEILLSLLHECRHAYDYETTLLYQEIPEEYKDLLMFYNVQRFTEEFKNYSSSEENLFEYYSQATEKSARNYSELAIQDYLEIIEEYSQKENNKKTEE